MTKCKHCGEEINLYSKVRIFGVIHRDIWAHKYGIVECGPMAEPEDDGE